MVNKLIDYFKNFIFILLVLTLYGCNPEIVELKVSTKELKDAISDGKVSVSFETSISILSNINEIKEELVKFENIAEDYFDLEEFDITENDFGVELNLEGKLPLIYGNFETPSNLKSPWLMQIKDNNNQGSLKDYQYTLSLNTSSSYGRFSALISDINILASINKFQPIKLRLKVSEGDNLKIFTGGVNIGSKSFVIMETTVEKKLTLVMSGGVYSKSFPKIFFILN